MFNEQRKMEYINVAGQIDKMGKSIMKRRFKQSEPYEIQLNKDLCEWSVVEIINFYKSQVIRSLESLMMMHSAYNRYASWCLANSMIPDSQNHFTEIDREILNAKCINKAYLRNGIVSRKELLKLLKKDDIRNFFEQFLILGAFEGIGGKQLLDFQNLTMDDFEGNTVKLRNRTLVISSELIHFASLASDEYNFYSYSDGRSDSQFKPDDKRIIKARENANELSGAGWNHKLNTIMRRISLNNDDSPVYNFAMLSESGRLEMIRNFMIQDNSDSLTTIKNHDDEIAVRYGRIQGRERFCDKWSEFLLDR